MLVEDRRAFFHDSRPARERDDRISCVESEGPAQLRMKPFEALRNPSSFQDSVDGGNPGRKQRKFRICDLWRRRIGRIVEMMPKPAHTDTERFILSSKHLSRNAVEFRHRRIQPARSQTRREPKNTYTSPTGIGHGAYPCRLKMTIKRDDFRIFSSLCHGHILEGGTEKSKKLSQFCKNMAFFACR